MMERPHNCRRCVVAACLLACAASTPAVQTDHLIPDAGTTDTTFTYYVHYYDPDGDPAATKHVYIDGMPHTMSLYSGYDSNGIYRFQTELAAGTHDYYFYFTDGRGASDRLPDTGTTPGPSVSPVIASHVFHIEISAGSDYKQTNTPNDLTYNFYLGIETDATVNLVEFRTPAGNAFQIPNDLSTHTDNVQTWHYLLDEHKHYWGYEAAFDDISGMIEYADGTYTITVHRSDAQQHQTTVWFGAPETESPIPQPTQKPSLAYPSANDLMNSPIEFSWQPCTDQNANSIYLALIDENGTYATDSVYPVHATTSEPWPLSRGAWQASLAFENRYDLFNLDGIAVQVGKYTTCGYAFDVVDPPACILLRQDFDDRDYAGWSIVDHGTTAGPSAWSASTGTMVQSSNLHSLPTGTEPAKLGTYAWYPAGIAWTDYAVSLHITSQDDDDIGLMFRCQNGKNYYRFSWDKQRNYRRLVKRVNGITSLLAQDNVPYVIGRDYLLEVLAQGPTLDVYIDRALIFSVTDHSLASGTVALYCWANAGSRFDDIVVENLSPVNFTPTISSVTATPSTIYDDQTCRLQVAAADPDFGPYALSYTWTVQPGQGWLSRTNIAKPLYAPPDLSSTQTFTLAVEVSDGEDVAAATVDVAVRDADALELLNDNFDDGDYAAWTIVDHGTVAAPSAWAASTGTMVQSSNLHSLPTGTELAKLGTYAWYPAGIGWTDYAVSLDIRSDDDDDIGLMFRYRNGKNYYRFSWDRQRNYRRLVKRVNGITSLLAQDNVPYVTGQNYHLDVLAQGASLEVYIDGAPVFSVTDNTFSSGAIALYSWADAGACFDDVRVDDLSP